MCSNRIELARGGSGSLALDAWECARRNDRRAQHFRAEPLFSGNNAAAGSPAASPLASAAAAWSRSSAAFSWSPCRGAPQCRGANFRHQPLLLLSASSDSHPLLNICVVRMPFLKSARFTFRHCHFRHLHPGRTILTHKVSCCAWPVTTSSILLGTVFTNRPDDNIAG